MSARVFFGSPGDDLSKMTELTGVVSDGFKLIGEASEETGRVLEAFSKSFTITLDYPAMNPDVHRALFKWNEGKRERKRFDRSHRQVRKAWTAHRRAEQRRAIGIKEQA